MAVQLERYLHIGTALAGSSFTTSGFGARDFDWAGTGGALHRRAAWGPVGSHPQRSAAVRSAPTWVWQWRTLHAERQPSASPLRPRRRGVRASSV
jgi:hypothetical protein